jgi:cytochrome c-type biogenesis protein
VDSITLARLALAFTIGLLATMNPCVLPLYPGFLAYLANNAANPTRMVNIRYLGFAALGGVMTMMLALGALIAGLIEMLGHAPAIIAPLGAAITLLMGFLLLLNVNPFARLPILASRTPVTGSTPHAEAFLYGLLFGPMIIPCAGPLVVSIFTLSLGVAGFVEQFLFFFIFGLGFGLPLLVLALLPQSLSGDLMRQVTRHSTLISRLSGLALIGFGIWNLRASWALLSLYVEL